MTDRDNKNRSKTGEFIPRAACKKARIARDARFDGLFFIGVKTTGIFCRPICPANPAKEENVVYFQTALTAVQAGFRPCLRCRPEAAPGSPASQGIQTTLRRAVCLIDKGEWREQSLPEFAQRLGVSDRYLRKLFQQTLGVSPLKYANFKRALFAKQLLQQTSLPVAEVGQVAGFGSVRRFNAVFHQVIGLAPRQLRHRQKTVQGRHQNLRVFLSYRPPYDWPALRDFYLARHITGLETVTGTSYGRSINHGTYEGWFIATHIPEEYGFSVELSLSMTGCLMTTVERIRRLLDLDADSAVISRHLASQKFLSSLNSEGIRLPGMWSGFEAGARAILGQQVSVKAAHKLVARLVEVLGKTLNLQDGHTAHSINRLFPSPHALAKSNLEFLAMPEKRRRALRGLAKHIVSKSLDTNRDNFWGSNMDNRGKVFDDEPDDAWLDLPGIGPWSLQYAKFRMGRPDIFLASDLGVKNAVKKLSGDVEAPVSVDANALSPWGSYATLLLWRSA